MTMFVVVVQFEVKPGHAQDFLSALKENARLSVEGEPGCRQFDVCTTPGKPESIFLYEVYDSEDAFKAHLATEHFLHFDRETASWVASKEVKTLSRVFPSVSA
ncbi:putative quinol monooxygenase [Bordetella sp. 02P26C-1]|uniref:putative quinol monooxygenase n=1 Tax=Bordetella sp. 02P26C-1 TaxID=2683195 RepID=UPI0019243700|nr:putative quinol monooxygenase [Bordetella sp. 02P26C-1]